MAWQYLVVIKLSRATVFPLLVLVTGRASAFNVSVKRIKWLAGRRRRSYYFNYPDNVANLYLSRAVPFFGLLPPLLLLFALLPTAWLSVGLSVTGRWEKFAHNDTLSWFIVMGSNTDILHFIVSWPSCSSGSGGVGWTDAVLNFRIKWLEQSLAHALRGCGIWIILLSWVVIIGVISCLHPWNGCSVH